jgi:hypothetical protein
VRHSAAAFIPATRRRAGYLPRTAAAGLILALLAAIAAGCSPSTANFSQHPGFREWYAAHPPAGALPTEADRALVTRYQPRLFVDRESEGPIGFYEDYVAEATLFRGDGSIAAEHPTRETLNAHKADPGAVLAHRGVPGHGAPIHPTVLGRIDREEVALPDGKREFTFLTYSYVFRRSGLPAGMPGWMRVLVGIVADPRDWHQLDHYTAVTIALAPGPDGASPVPVAAVFQQHNYLRSYLLGRTAAPGVLALPADGRLPVDAAIWSNELYPHEPGRVRHRAVPFMTRDTVRYLMTGEDPPFLAADDVTEPDREVDCTLRFLPPADAFYVFQGWLGERRRLPGRDGPPGADYNTLPAYKSRAAQMLVFRWTDGDAGYAQTIAPVLDGRGSGAPPDLSRFLASFARDLRCRDDTGESTIRLACAPGSPPSGL